MIQSSLKLQVLDACNCATPNTAEKILHFEEMLINQQRIFLKSCSRSILCHSITILCLNSSSKGHGLCWPNETILPLLSFAKGSFLDNFLWQNVVTGVCPSDHIGLITFLFAMVLDNRQKQNKMTLHWFNSTRWNDSTKTTFLKVDKIIIT